MPGTQIWCAAMLLSALLLAVGCEENRSPAAVERSSKPTTDSAPQSTAGMETAEAASAEGDTVPSSPEVPEPKAAPLETTSAAPQNITFDTLKFPLEKNDDYQRSLLTPAIASLDHRPVKLRGYILPSFQQSGLTQFVLVRDNMQCCFGPGAALYDCVVVNMKPGKTADFTVRPVAVEGTFELRDYKGPDGKFLAIYHLDGDAVRF
jgi:hypothetical protein